jgi:hypothetical protein
MTKQADVRGHTCLAERFSCRGSANVEQVTELLLEFGARFWYEISLIYIRWACGSSCPSNPQRFDHSHPWNPPPLTRSTP